MNKTIVESYGKINLALDVLYKRADGYHELNTVMQQISLKDRLIFKEIDRGIKIESKGLKIPLDESNLVYKTWKYLRDLSGVESGIHIVIEKNIPVAAGLAGGSSNAAATLKALNQIWDLNLSLEELMEIGVKLGADIPFCLLGGTALGKGIGNILTPLKPFKDVHILLGNPGLGVSSEYAYNKLNLGDHHNMDISKLISCMDKRDLKCVGENFKNIMEAIIIEEHPIIQKIKDNMMASGSLGTLMSGSGPTVFGLFENEETIIAAREKLLEIIDKVYICKTI
ncbi:MAG: 4-(cytidine 5'-diphospho)-2-C-methyl-D-erythritol kinase [Tissierellia bacterium]|nr:4-(cytidine 5'-diphospho)-2-C-methyl-D-erythritol kinase [Tissierellia bacterium]